ncbi:MAG: IPT/TIG domain-containing protein [Planctomycetota bacterium]
MGLRTRSLGLVAVALLALAASTHVRLRNPSNGAELYWENPGSIGIVINSTGSDDLVPDEHVPALRLAIEEWNRVAGSAVQLVENTSASARARSDWQADAVHLILFDEDNSSGYFPQGSATVALTPVQFFSNGRIADADILFNGAGQRFTTSGEFGAFDVQDVATHELGHLLGLDHTGVAGATLYPYVSPSILGHRSLASDDANGIRANAPEAGASLSTITGTVLREADLSVVAGAHVIARDTQGRNAGAALSGSDGTFALRGLGAGSYTLFATPLDAPVSAGNLGGARTIQTDFQPRDGVAIGVGAGATASVGSLLVGADSPVSLGRNYDDFPLRAERGRGSAHLLRGAGMGTGASLASSDPSVTLSNITWIGTTSVSFVVNVPADEPLGHVDLELRNGALSVLAGAIEITPVDPAVTLVSPAQGPLAGGTLVTVSGSGFRAGATVVLGNELYLDGVAGGCTVVDASTITLVTRAAGASAISDVVVQDASGVEGRAVGAFEFVDVPQIESVFPAVGSDTGGTVVKVRGSGLFPPLVVRIDGVVQTDVTLRDGGFLHFVTEPGFAGSPAVLEIEDADGDVASDAFLYVAQPDPVIAQVSPSSGPTAGGTSLSIAGAHLQPGCEVLFGMDEETGLGGTPAVGVTWVDAGRVDAITPPLSAGDVNVAVRDTTTGQVTVLAGAFLFVSGSSSGGSGGGGGGGGGCGSVVGAPPMEMSDRIAAAGWIPALLALLALAQLRRQRALRLAPRRVHEP